MTEQFYMGNLIPDKVTNCATPAEFETAMQNAIAARSNARVDDFEAWAVSHDLSKYSDGSYAGNFAACAWPAWQARQPEIDALKARIKELEAQTQWQPIETAPKDGTEILIWYPVSLRTDINGWRVIASWKHNYAFYKSGSDIPINGVHTPTHWMPLPQPPKDNE